MTIIYQNGFVGEQPAASRRTRSFSDSRASSARNMSLYDKRISPVKRPVNVYTTHDSSLIKTLYHYKSGSNVNWLTWNSTVDVARSPVAQDSLGRIYFSGDGEPRMTTLASAISGLGPYPAAWFVLGVTAPKTAPTIAPPAGGTTETRAYVYTFRTALGEESEPSPAATASGNQAGTWALSGLDTAPANTGSITNISIAAGVATVTIGNTFGLYEGEEVNLASTGITGLDGKHQVLTVTSTTFSVVFGGAGSSVTGTWTRVAPHNTTGMTKRIYRLAGTSSIYLLVDEIAVATTTYSDSKTATQLGVELPSEITDLPPKDLHSLIALPNGSFAGLSKNELCFSEINKPHSWPIDYRYSFSSIGVALVAEGNSIIVLTDRTPLVATFSTPASVSITELVKDTFAPCVSKRGVVAAMGGAIYPSFNGPTLAAPGLGVKNLGIPSEDDPFFKIEQWAELKPDTMVAAYFDRDYLAAYTPSGLPVEILALNPTAPSMMRRFDQPVDGLHVSDVDGFLYFALGSDIYKWAADTTLSRFAYWLSLDYQLDKKTTFNVFQVHAAWDEVPALDATLLTENLSYLDTATEPGGGLGGSPIGAVPIGGTYLHENSESTEPSVTLIFYSDGEIKDVRTIKDSQIYKLKSGFKSSTVALAIFTNVPVISWSIAESVNELKQIP